jgi:hypothetical protein
MEGLPVQGPFAFSVPYCALLKRYVRQRQKRWEVGSREIEKEAIKTKVLQDTSKKGIWNTNKLERGKDKTKTRTTKTTKV